MRKWTQEKLNKTESWFQLYVNCLTAESIMKRANIVQGDVCYRNTNTLVDINQPWEVVASSLSLSITLWIYHRITQPITNFISNVEFKSILRRLKLPNTFAKTCSKIVSSLWSRQKPEIFTNFFNTSRNATKTFLSFNIFSHREIS